MKKSVTTILDGCQPQELDGLLENINGDLPTEASADNIKRLALQKAGIMSRRRRVRRIALIAACVTLLAGILVGCYVAEKVEYDSAVKFFDLNNIDTEGMSRDDIKRVWRDMTTESFTRDESAALLMQTGHEVYRVDRDTDRVEGMDISIMNNANNRDFDTIEVLDNGYGYGDTNHGAIPDNTKYFVGDEFEKFVDGDTVWRTKLPHYYNGYYLFDGKALIWSSYIYDTKHDYMHTSVALIDDQDGKILWEKTLESTYNFDEYGAAAINDDGQIGILTQATDNRFSVEKVLVFRELDLSGKVVREVEQPQNVVFINHFTPLSDGWLADVMVDDPSSDDEDSVSTLAQRFLKLDRGGKVQAMWSLNDSDSTEYDIFAMTEYDGKIYLSVQARQYPSHIYDDFDRESFEISAENPFGDFSDDMRDRAREEFSSVLFVCDPESGKPEQFYSVGGTLPADLVVDDDGNLVWRVGRIVKCGYSPMTSSYTLYSITRQYNYTFDKDNALLKEEKTDIFKSFKTI